VTPDSTRGDNGSQPRSSSQRFKVEVVKLLGPHHPGQRLAHHIRRVRIERRWDDRCVEFVRLVAARLHHSSKILAECATDLSVGAIERFRLHRRQPHTDDFAFPGRH
jgi:hypothetical protein